MLDASALQQVKSYLDRLVNPITLTFAGDASEASEQIRSLLSDLASVSKLITVADAPADLQVRRPSFTISRTGENMGIRFAALPMGHEFSSLILALLQASGYPSKSAPDLLNRVRGLQGDYDFVVYMSLSCHNCPDVVQALNLMAVLNPNVRVTTVDGALFQDEVKERRIMAVPTVFLNGKEFMAGRHELGEIVAKLDEGFVKEQAAKLSAKAPFDVLVVGAGPPVPQRPFMPPAKGCVRDSSASVLADKSTKQALLRTSRQSCRLTAWRSAVVSWSTSITTALT